MAIFKSMSKAYGIWGLRIGYMLTANSRFAEAVRNGVHIWNINGFAEEFLRLLPKYKLPPYYLLWIILLQILKEIAFGAEHQPCLFI